jgi:hypothetical protein
MLAPVTGVTASQGVFANDVKVGWNQLGGNVSGYQILRNTTNNPATATAVGTVAAGISATYKYHDTTASPGVQYYYWVCATNSTALGQFGTAAPGFATFAAPTGLVAGTGPSNMRITWAAVPNATKYVVFRGTDSNPANATKIPTTTSITAALYVDTGADIGGLAVGQMYYYWVRASNNLTSGPKSAFVSVEAYLAAPTGLHASGRAIRHNVTLTWNAEPGAVKYQVFCSTTKNFANARLVSGAATTNTFMVDPLATSGPLYYWVRAKSPLGFASGYLTYTA